MFTKFATFEDAQVLDVKGSPTRKHAATLDKLNDFHDYRTDDGYMYVRLRAISSRVNKNNDGWPSIELAGGPEIFDRHAKQSSSGFTVEASEGNPKFGFATFMGKPNFIDHNNSNPERARGVVVDAKLKVLPIEKVASSGDDYWTSASLDPEHAPPTEIELLLEIDAKQFPKYAKAIRNGDLDGFSMGCDVERSKCSHCGHEATNPEEYCSHILMKGAHHDYKTADGKRISRKSYENCYGIHFFEISGVFDPADETALAREVRAGVIDEGLDKTSGFMKGSPDPGDDAYFGGEHGSAKKAYDSMVQQYGKDKGEEVYYATRNKKKGKSKDSSTHIAENPLPQSFETTAPEPIDTMRQEHKCPICGEQMEGETCDVCGYVEPPKGMDNPDLTKAKELQHDMAQGSQEQIQEDNALAQGTQSQPMPPPGGPAPRDKQPGSFLQTRNINTSAQITSDMRWQPKLNPKVAARIKHLEKPLLPGTAPASNDPVTTTVVKNPQKPVTAAMRTAQDLIEAAKNNHTGETMSTTHTADGPTGPEAAPDARVDATGVGGVIEPSNEAASTADAQVDVTGVGSTGVTNVEAEKTESLPTASESSDDSGFEPTHLPESDSGPTSTFGDSDGTQKGFTDGVTNESLEGNQNKQSSYVCSECQGDHHGQCSGGNCTCSKCSHKSNVRQAYDAKPFYDQPGLSGGSANQGTQPADPVGNAQDRVDVLQAVTTPENNSGPTKQWTGTDGNQVERQQDPVTQEVSDMQFDGFTSHFVASLKLADLEVDLGLIEKDDKYSRLAELSPQSDEEISAQMDMLSRVKTAGAKKLAAQRTAGVTRMPGAFGKMTASSKRFDSVISSDDEQKPAAEDELDSALFA